MVALVLLCSACGSPPGEPDDPAPSGPPPAVRLASASEQRGASLHISYELVNDSSEELVVLGRVPVDPQPGGAPGTAYVVGAEQDGRVQIATRVFGRPEGARVSFAQAPTVGGTDVGAGGSTGGDVAVPLPLTRTHPYEDDYGDGDVELPDPVRELVFCVGVIRKADLAGQTFRTDESGTVVPHLTAIAALQHLACSQPFQP